MDSFEVNAQFASLLRSLNPSVQSLRKAAHFAIKNWENEDYLFPSILQILQDSTIEINTKSTIFQFIDILINESYTISLLPKSNYSYPYIRNLKDALPSILLDVLPGKNNYNLYNVFNSLRNISKTLKINHDEYKSRFNDLSVNIFDQQDKENIELNVPYPDISIDEVKHISDPIIKTWELIILKRKQSFYERLRLLKHQPALENEVEENQMFSLRPKDKPDPNELSKKQILMRMEDDRETHKRSKESMWIVNRPKDSNYVTEDEFYHYYWNKYEVLTGDEEKALLQTLEDFNEVVMASYKDNQF